MLEMAKESSSIMVTPVNNAQIDFKSILLDIVLVCEEILFNFICLLFQWLNMVKPQLLAIPNIHVKYYHF